MHKTEPMPSQGSNFWNDDNSENLCGNDVYLARTTGQSANLRIDIDGVNVVEKLRRW